MAKKALGQHWLRDEASLESIIDTAELEPHDTVLEIGPGQGDLTKYLLDEVDTVIAVELDADMVEHLVQTLPDGKLFLMHQDIREFDFTRLPPGYKVVANIPYYITSNLVRQLLEQPNKPATITLLVQKEVAERMTAKPGDLSVLGVSVQFYADAELGDVIEAQHFDPPPKIDSQVVHMRVLGYPRFDVDEKKFFRLVKAGFSAKRKKLKSALAGGLRLSKEQTAELLSSAGVSPDSRAQELSLQDWHKLYNSWQS